MNDFKKGQYVNYHSRIGGPVTGCYEIRSGPLRIPSSDEPVYWLDGKPGCVAASALSEWRRNDCGAPHPTGCVCG